MSVNDVMLAYVSTNSVQLHNLTMALTDDRAAYTSLVPRPPSTSSIALPLGRVWQLESERSTAADDNMG